MNSEENRKIETEEIISKIFRDTKELKRDKSGKGHILYYFGRYYPKHGRPYCEMDEFSSMILDVKKDEEELDEKSREYEYYENALNYLGSRLRNILSDNEEFVICVIPSSQKGTQPSGIRTIAKSLCSPNRIDGTDFIRRTKTIPKKHLGGERDLDKEVESLHVKNVNIIKDKIVLLLDDVTTSGTTLDAGITILNFLGAKEVVALALGKTTY